jgi:hypothetical protein
MNLAVGKERKKIALRQGYLAERLRDTTTLYAVSAWTPGRATPWVRRADGSAA